MEVIKGICGVVLKDGNRETLVSRDENGVFHCENLKETRCNLDKKECNLRRFLPFMAAIDANSPIHQRAIMKNC